MTYTAPGTKTPPTPTLASDWNTYIRDNEITLRANALSGMGELIQTQTISAAASVTFSSLTANYTHLGFTIYDLYADATSALQIRFNADSGANYDYAFLGHTTGDADASGGATGATSFQVTAAISAAATSYATIVHGYIPHYRTTSKRKFIVCTGYGHTKIFSMGGFWDSSAITSVSFLFGGNNGTGTFCVYGMDD